jgi:terminase small subunit-like protein
VATLHLSELVRAFHSAYARAREMQAEYFVDELSLIADDGRNDFMRRMREHGEEFVAVDREHLERSKIRIGTRQWIIERILANKYGPKPQVVVNNQQNVVSIGLIQANSDRYCADQTCSPSH